MGLLRNVWIGWLFGVYCQFQQFFSKYMTIKFIEGGNPEQLHE
jgi:hypothetical protein